MRIIEQHSVGGPEVLAVAEVAVPEPGTGEVRVKVGAAGINPVDAAVRAGHYPLLGETPFVLGWDIAGTVDAIGEGVSLHRVGDRVFGMPRFPSEARAYAEYVVVPAEELVKTPEPLDDEHAAAIPLAGLTAWQALIEAGELQAGQRVLIHGAGGGVGHLAVQIAKARGAYVIATASPGKVEFVTGLGADEVIDYTAGDFAEGLDPVDVALDPLSGDITARTLAVIRDSGVLATLVAVTDEAVAEEAIRRNIRHVKVFVAPRREALVALADLADDGKLIPHISGIYPLEKAGDAHEQLAQGGPGKIVLVP
ncbi:MAG: NADP-dependent oxidoreductase [Actinomycetota bacterium]|nr:NADP-dependent oxidoreductase [Actinomycetota bacterium]